MRGTNDHITYSNSWNKFLHNKKRVFLKEITVFNLNVCFQMFIQLMYCGNKTKRQRKKVCNIQYRHVLSYIYFPHFLFTLKMLYKARYSFTFSRAPSLFSCLLMPVVCGIRGRVRRILIVNYQQTRGSNN